VCLTLTERMLPMLPTWIQDDYFDDDSEDEEEEGSGSSGGS